MNKVYLLLGGNAGNRKQYINKAIDELSLYPVQPGIKSSFYETAAWGKEDQPEFLNIAIYIETSLSPTELLNAIHEIESNAGRLRTEKWGQRTLDMDILFYNTEIIELPELTIPHPYMQDRRFTLVPLAEIAPDLMHPVFKKTISQLLEECPDKLEVRKVD